MAIITDETRTRPGVGHAGPGAPPRTRTRRRGGARRIGSRQIVSHRGRRLTTTTLDRSRQKFGVIVLAVFIAGIGFAMWLSGMSTQTSLELGAARDREQALADRVSVLERDAEYLTSTAEIARRAGEMGMVDVKQPTVLAYDAEGNLVEVRQGDPDSQRLIDINGAPERPDAPTSDPEKTDALEGGTTPLVPDNAQAPGMVPYQPAQPAPAPQVIPAPAPAPAPEDAAPAPEDAAPAPIPLPAPAPANAGQAPAPAVH